MRKKSSRPPFALAGEWGWGQPPLLLLLLHQRLEGVIPPPPLLTPHRTAPFRLHVVRPPSTPAASFSPAPPPPRPSAPRSRPHGRTLRFLCSSRPLGLMPPLRPPAAMRLPPLQMLRPPLPPMELPPQSRPPPPLLLCLFPSTRCFTSAQRSSEPTRAWQRCALPSH